MGAIGQEHIAKGTSILVEAARLARDYFPKNQRCRSLLGSIAESLALLGAIDPAEADTFRCWCYRTSRVSRHRGWRQRDRRSQRKRNRGKGGEGNMSVVVVSPCSAWEDGEIGRFYIFRRPSLFLRATVERLPLYCGGPEWGEGKGKEE
jgi:hypothetical protein